MYKDAPKTTHTSSASVLVTKEEAGILFLALGKGRMFEEEIPVILNTFAEYATRKGKQGCEEGENDCILTSSVGDFNPKTGWNCQYAGQIGFRCACNNSGVGIAYKAVVEDLEGTISRSTNQSPDSSSLS